ncbi:disintegrin and metalloproteinase domain-containing protein 9-like [Microcaecilia unicolor]|uniref:Disintegrin and metalloproteinase domain-containing protein 9-like n=1 Tax=Microcaecilia unicolor TaxID=1415580 RepID=A0A6P7Y6I8_9AMPH|nr:disintegrin and metalloproteinase domain-containing protein 9-like [Microcaecilia unicolor]
MWKSESLLGPGLLLFLPQLLPPLLVSSKDLNQTSWLSSYEIVIPKKLEPKGVSDGEVLSYSIVVTGKQYTLRLKKKTVLLSPHFPVFTYSKSGALIFEEPHIQDDCYFNGYVEGIADSSVALSTCAGLRGFLKIKDFNYGIEPLQPFSKFQHRIYWTEDRHLEGTPCGINETNEHLFLPVISEDLAPAPSETGIVLTDIQYVEAFVVVSKQRYDKVNNETAMIMQVIDIVNIADTLFQSLNVKIVLVGLEIWTTKELISPESGVLGNFNKWKTTNLDLRVKCDSAAFALQKGAGAHGLAFIGAICIPSQSGFFATLSSNNMLANAIVYAHELGHTLGFLHDDEYCHCTEKVCIMYKYASLATTFSNCSRAALVKQTVFESTRCLWNYPPPGSTYVMQRCGNRIVETGEQCDCGSQKECAQNKCCEPGTCKFKTRVECAHGNCCTNCKFAPAGKLCRPSVSECDLPEVCTGISAVCPPDVYLKNGLPCKQDKLICYNKVCYDYKQHCKEIFGPEAEVAPKACFKSANVKGDRFGNCGFDESYIKCAEHDVMCGRLQCVQVFSLPSSIPDHSTIIQATVEKNLCYGVDHHFGMDMIDFGAVHDGAKCESEKICVNRKCVSLSSLSSDCNNATTCSGRGVCNNKNNCHCKRGFTPPDCARGGFGGSIDSGPMRDISYVDVPTTTEMTYITKRKHQENMLTLIRLEPGWRLSDSAVHCHKVSLPLLGWLGMLQRAFTALVGSFSNHSHRVSQ